MSKIEVCEELLEIIDKQGELIKKLSSKNIEQENMINVLMKENCEE